MSSLLFRKCFPSPGPGDQGSLLGRIRWGEKSVVALCLSLLSGLIVALQYDVAEPAYSVHSIDILVPFGLFWRSLHFWSSQIFFLLSACHLYVVFVDRRFQVSLGRWLLLIGSLPLTVLLLFTGYVLRGDVTGESAGLIAENIAVSVPVAGELANALLFSITADGMRRVFVNHAVGLGLLWLFFCWDHIRKFRLDWDRHGVLLLITVLLSLVFDAPLEPGRPGMPYVSGPWFFLGLQELLRYLRPFLAGVLFPASFIMGLLLSRVDEGWRRHCARYCAGWLAVYTVLSVLGWSRGG